jgi:hypothetical protein
MAWFTASLIALAYVVEALGWVLLVCSAIIASTDPDHAVAGAASSFLSCIGAPACRRVLWGWL